MHKNHKTRLKYELKTLRRQKLVEKGALYMYNIIYLSIHTNHNSAGAHIIAPSLGELI